MGIVEKAYRTYLKSEENDTCVLESGVAARISIEFEKQHKNAQMRLKAESLYSPLKFDCALQLFKMLNTDVCKSNEFYLTAAGFIRLNLKKQGMELIEEGYGGSQDKHALARLDAETLSSLDTELKPFLLYAAQDDHGKTPLRLTRLKDEEGYCGQYRLNAIITSPQQDMLEHALSVETALEEWASPGILRTEKEGIEQEEKILWG